MKFMLLWAILSLLGYNSQNCLKLLFSSEFLEIDDSDLQSALELSTELASSMKSKFSKFSFEFSIKFIKFLANAVFPYCSDATFSYQDDFL